LVEINPFQRVLALSPQFIAGHLFHAISVMNLSNPKDSQSVLLQVTDLWKSFDGQQVLQNASVKLHHGEVVLLRGANGTGKTTLLNILTGNLQPDRGSIEIFMSDIPVKFQFPETWWQKLDLFQRFCPEGLARLGLNRTWQDPRLFASETLEDNVAIASPNQLGEQPQWSILRSRQVYLQERLNLSKAQERLARLGLAGREKSSADRISLGQSKRVMIARTLQTKAQILFLDEPMAGLDNLGMTEITNILRQLVQEENITLVIVEHLFNIPRILELATTVWTLKDGEILVEQPEDVREQVLRSQKNGIQEWLMRSQEGKALLQLPLRGGALLEIARSTDIFDQPPVLEVENLVVARGQRQVLQEGLSFCLRRGDLAVLQAPNGWGKTTLLEAIAGLIPIISGSIWLNGKPIDKLVTCDRVKLGMAFLQSRDNIFPDLTVREALQLSHVDEPPENIRIFSDQQMTSLSGGERQRILLACLSKSASLYLYDEPFLALDASGIESVWQLIQPQDDRTCLIVVPSTVMEA
jgi:branched-chain amino acid transport system ATP-binding protein